MAKHKKTRREKKAADKRHTLYHLEAKASQEEIKVSKKKTIPTYKIENTDSRVAVATHDYIKQDIRKILMVSSAIFVTQIVLYIILNRV